jgi:Ca2+/Na+ antiporter
MLKNYICFTAAFIVFVISILFLSTYIETKPFIIMFALGVMFAVFLLNAGFNKRDFDERKYKKIIREKNNEIKTLRILHKNAAQAADDFFKQIQAQGK